MPVEQGEPIINAGWKITKVYVDNTKFRMTEGQTLIVKARTGEEHEPVVKFKVPDGKDVIVHLHLDIYEGPMNG